MHTPTTPSPATAPPVAAARGEDADAADRAVALRALDVACRAHLAAKKHLSAHGLWTDQDRRGTNRIGKRRRFLRDARGRDRDGAPIITPTRIWAGVERTRRATDALERRLAQAGLLHNDDPPEDDSSGDAPNNALDTAPNDNPSDAPAGDPPAAAGMGGEPTSVASEADAGAVARRTVGPDAPDRDDQDPAAAPAPAQPPGEGAGARPAGALAGVRVDELRPAERERFVQRERFVELVSAGVAVMEAVAAAGLRGHHDDATGEPRLLSERGARHLLARYRREGPSALLDRRLRTDVAGRNPRCAREAETDAPDAVLASALDLATGRTPRRHEDSSAAQGTLWPASPGSVAPSAGAPDAAHDGAAHDAPALPRTVEGFVLAAWAAGCDEKMPAVAGVPAIRRRVEAACEKAALPAPSESTVRRILGDEPLAAHLLRAGQDELWAKRGRAVVRTDHGATRGNDRAQFDHSTLDLWAAEEAPDHPDGLIAVPVYISASLDAVSRTGGAFLLETVAPTAWTTALLLRRLILPKRNRRWFNRGIPFIYQPDRGKTLTSQALQLSLRKLGARFEPDPPYYPNNKGKVEAWFRHLDSSCLRDLPGHKLRKMVSQEAAQKKVHKLLRLGQIYDHVETWLVDYYHEKPHRELGGRTPNAVWRDTAVIRMPEAATEDDALDVLLMQHDKIRQVRNVGIEFTFPGRPGRGGIYWHEALSDWSGRKVRLAFDPEDDARIICYPAEGGARICVADKDPDPERVKQHRRDYDRQVKAKLLAHLDAGRADEARRAGDEARPGRERAAAQRGTAPGGSTSPGPAPTGAATGAATDPAPNARPHAPSPRPAPPPALGAPDADDDARLLARLVALRRGEPA